MYLHCQVPQDAPEVISLNAREPDHIPCRHDKRYRAYVIIGAAHQNIIYELCQVGPYSPEKCFSHWSHKRTNLRVIHPECPRL